MRIWKHTLLATAGLMGASGVALAAASAHLGGENLATAATFLLIHAVATIALALHGDGRLFLLSASLLAAGAILFSADIAVRTFGAGRLFAMAAPAGGVTMIVGWLTLSAAALRAAITRP